jgi:Rrf2 family protein
MKISEGVEWGLHCCSILAMLPPGYAMPASRLAEFHELPPAYLAKHLQALSRAGIVESSLGPRGGYRLAKPPDQVSMLDVVLAIDGDELAFTCTEIRRCGPAKVDASEYVKPCGIARAMHAAEHAWRAELRGRSIADLVAALPNDVSPRAAAKALVWFQEVLR